MSDAKELQKEFDRLMAPVEEKADQLRTKALINTFMICSLGDGLSVCRCQQFTK